MNHSYTEENYLKAIYHLQEVNRAVSTNNLSAMLQSTPASITDMLKKLATKKLITYKAYYGCKLTSKGKTMALHIIRRHRLWEYFLSQKLGFNWDEVHDVAEELEHVSSEKLIGRLDAFLGFPKADPHGDPIPDANGNITATGKISLDKLSEKKSAVVAQIGNQSVVALDMLNKKNIHIGTHIEILKKYPFDESMEIKTDKKHLSHISKELSQNIFIEN